MNNNLVTHKRTLRTQVKQMLAWLDDHTIRYGHSNEILTLLRHSVWRAAVHVYAFLPCKFEPPILPLLDIALTQKKEVLIPVPDITPQLCRPYRSRNNIVLGSLHRAVLTRVPIPYRAAHATWYDRPLLDCIRDALLYPSLILVPGQMFSYDGMRLGRGGGFYDRLLHALPHTVVKIGVCYHTQIVNAVPYDAHDVPMDYLLSEDGLCKVR